MTTVAASGLSTDEVRERIRTHRTNRAEIATSRTVTDIIKANVLTLFNAILGVAVVAILLTRSWPDAVFGIVLVSNIATGVLTELKAKRTLDQLAVLDAPHVHVIRDGKEQMIDVADVVLDDLLHIKAGDQIPADAVVLDVFGLEIDESILTGESVPVKKKADDELLSGTSAVAGSGYAKVTKVGADAYAYTIANQVKRFTVARSELRAGIDTVLKVVSWVIVPMALLIGWAQVRASGGWDAMLDSGWRAVVVSAVAGVVALVPQGLVLLTSVNFALAAMMLARKKVLVQELPAVEVLARVDTICLDKTGTITSGDLEFDSIESDDPVLCAQILKAMDSKAANATALAIRVGIEPILSHSAARDSAVRDLGEPGFEIPFSSARKWAGMLIGDRFYLLGAPEIVVPDDSDVQSQTEAHARTGARVLALGSVHITDELRAALQEFGESEDSQFSLPAGIEALGLVILREEIRPDAPKTLAWFASQDVEVRIVSGDNPDTVAAIAKRVGLEVGQAVCDARTLPDPQSDPEQFRRIVEATRVFGRVTPEQKRAIVKALQAEGHTVAMTGDGVNDALALKKADLGIAMGNGARATKAASKLVLMDGRFSRLPSVMAEGRRVIANMERVSALFLNKTTYAMIFAIAVSIMGASYVFMPRHLTLLGAFTIGIPAFFLALPPNSQRYRPGFLKRTLALAVPTGIVGGIAVIVASLIRDTTPEQASTRATVIIAVASITLLAMVSRPLFGWRAGLLVAMIAALLAVLMIPFLRHFFALAILGRAQWTEVAVICAISVGLIVVSTRLLQRRIDPSATRRKPGHPRVHKRHTV